MEFDWTCDFFHSWKMSYTSFDWTCNFLHKWKFVVWHFGRSLFTFFSKWRVRLKTEFSDFKTFSLSTHKIILKKYLYSFKQNYKIKYVLMQKILIFVSRCYFVFKERVVVKLILCLRGSYTKNIFFFYSRLH